MMARVGHDYARRISRAAGRAEKAGLDGLVISPSSDLIYLVGYEAPLLERLTALVVRPGRDTVLIVPQLERPRAEAAPVGRLVQMEVWKDGEDPFVLVQRLLGSARGTLAVSDRMFAVHLLGLQAALPEAKFVPSSSILSPLRSVKDAGEIDLLARAGRGADEAFRRVCREGLSGRTEEDVARSLSSHLIDNGHESTGFAIVGSGPNGASPHHRSGDRTIHHRDAVVLDFGGRVGGYCSDMTRTVAVGEPPDEVREIHEVVAAAQEAAFRAVRPGVRAEEVDRAARGVIDEAGFGGAFIHRTGHGIGLEEHEEPYIVEGNDTPLEAGMCFSIEPGVYLEGRFGVRIEDIVCVTADGANRLNHAPRDLLIVG